MDVSMKAPTPYMISSSCGSFSSTSTSFTDVTNLSVTITTSGRPVRVGLIHDSSSGSIGATYTGQNAIMNVQILRDATSIYYSSVSFQGVGTTACYIDIPASSVNTLDVPSAGTYTYKVQVKTPTASYTARVSNAKLVAYEI